MAKRFPSSKSEIVSKILQGGVVGAGGAGFPTHVKAQARADMVIANACECEPLVKSDRHVIEASTDDVLEGLALMMLATGAAAGRVAVRESQEDLIRFLTKAVGQIAGITVATVEDSYPAGDEHLVVYEIAGRVVPQGGIPPDVGVVVSNVNTLVGVARAVRGKPVTDRVVSVCGDVADPVVVEVPLGTSIGDVLALTGNDAGLARKGILLSGVMMGEFTEDLMRPIDKRTGAIVVLPRDNEVIVRKSLPVETIVRRAASVCCQCTFCTELCPRHLIGHAIAPHKIMRSVGWTRVFTPDIAGALFCSGCGLCGVYACPMLLSPDRISFLVRTRMAERGIKVAEERTAAAEMVRPHRLIPHQRILEKTGIIAYDRALAFAGSVGPKRVALPLKQHWGAPARPLVKVGDRVAKGQLVASAPEAAIGAAVHASLDGAVVSVGDSIVVEME